MREDEGMAVRGRMANDSGARSERARAGRLRAATLETVRILRRLWRMGADWGGDNGRGSRRGRERG